MLNYFYVVCIFLGIVCCGPVDQEYYILRKGLLKPLASDFHQKALWQEIQKLPQTCGLERSDVVLRKGYNGKAELLEALKASDPALDLTDDEVDFGLYALALKLLQEKASQQGLWAAVTELFQRKSSVQAKLEKLEHCINWLCLNELYGDKNTLEKQQAKQKSEIIVSIFMAQEYHHLRQDPRAKEKDSAQAIEARYVGSLCKEREGKSLCQERWERKLQQRERFEKIADYLIDKTYKQLDLPATDKPLYALVRTLPEAEPLIECNKVRQDYRAFQELDMDRPQDVLDATVLFPRSLPVLPLHTDPATIDPTPPVFRGPDPEMEARASGLEEQTDEPQSVAEEQPDSRSEEAVQQLIQPDLKTGLHKPVLRSSRGILRGMRFQQSMLYIILSAFAVFRMGTPPLPELVVASSPWVDLLVRMGYLSIQPLGRRYWRLRKRALVPSSAIWPMR